MTIIFCAVNNIKVNTGEKSENMSLRTDLAVEMREILTESERSGVDVKKWKIENAEVTQVEILTPEGEKAMGKPKGKYITVDLPEFSHESELLDGRLTALTKTLRELLPQNCRSVLVAGLGNENITPDALGPMCAKQIFATRHIEKTAKDELGIAFLRPVCAVSTGVLGQTGIETAEYIASMVKLVKPDAVIVVDALASRKLSRVGKTVQLSDTGISPGSGVGNARAKINAESAGAPVIAVGVPTVVDAATIVSELTDGNDNSVKGEASEMMVTPRDIDTVISRAARLLSLSINCALQPEAEPQLFLEIM